MRGCVRTLAGAGLVAVLALGASATVAAAKGKPKRKPGLDLAITQIAVKASGQPPYITLDTSSRASGFVVKVFVTNDGSETSGKSVVLVQLEEKGRVKFSKDEFIAPQKPGSKPKAVSFAFDGVELDPGFLTAKATVTWAVTKTRQKSDSDSAKPVPVIVHDWNVSSFQTRINVGGQGPSGQTQGDGTLTYRFSRYDEADAAFIYKAYGQLTNQAHYDGGGCSGSASKSLDMGASPWPGDTSELMIKADLTQYNAGVEARDQPPVTVNVTCPQLNNVSFPVQVPWENLETYNGSPNFPRMTPDQTTLTDQGSKMTPVGELKFVWTFNARLSGT